MLETRLSEEVAGRIEVFQAKLRENGIAAALLVQSADLVYYTGTYQSGHLYLPAEGKPVFMVRRDFNRARETACVEDVVPLRSYKDIPALIAEFGLPVPEVLGLEFDVLPVSFYLHYQKIFPRVRFVDVSYLIRLQRAVKSLYEVEVLTASGKLLDAMLAAVPRVVGVGKPEVEMAGLLEGEARSLGHQGFIRFRGLNPDFFMGHLLTGPSGAVPSYFDGPVAGPGLDPTFAFGAGWRRLKPNEPVYVDYGAAYRGYITDATRVFVVGQLSPWLARAHNVALEIQAALFEAVKPGVSPAFLYHLAVRMAREAGLEEYFQGWRQPVRFVGHGVGLELNELPVIAAGVEEPLAPGMVFALEPKFVFPGEGAVGIENTVVVTEKGVKRLTNFPDEVGQIPCER
ncbi:MAG: Xaa-Pro peptidase family protein [Bacillota bacterium]